MAAPDGTTVVTGASSGIGEALAKIFAARADRLVLVSRGQGELDRVADEITRAGAERPLVVPLDLGQPGAADRLMATLREHDLAVHTLVNNAGFGLVGEAAELDRAEQVNCVDVNVRALVDLTLAALPDILARRGGILNVASIAGLIPGGPGFTTYYATKAFVVSFTRGLGQELAPLGVKVCALCPGPTVSRFGERAGVDPQTLGGGFPVMTAHAVAQEGVAAFDAGRRVAVTGLANRLATGLFAVMPAALTMPLLHKAQRRRTA